MTITITLTEEGEATVKVVDILAWAKRIRKDINNPTGEQVGNLSEKELKIVKTGMHSAVDTLLHEIGYDIPLDQNL